MEISIKLNYMVIGLITLVVSTLGRVFSSAGMRWYYTLNLPSFTPPSWVFGIAWTIIFALTATAAALVWNRFERNRHFWFIIGLFVANAFLNILWTYLFFSQHKIGFALADAVLLFITVLSLIVLIGQCSLFVASLLAPYLGWTTFAIVLNAAVWWMN